MRSFLLAARALPSNSKRTFWSNRIVNFFPCVTLAKGDCSACPRASRLNVRAHGPDSGPSPPLARGARHPVAPAGRPRLRRVSCRRSRAARKGTRSRRAPDHTSVLKLIEEKWNLPALTRRDAAATSPLGALDLTAPPAFLTPPELPAPALAWGTW